MSIVRKRRRCSGGVAWSAVVRMMARASPWYACVHVSSLEWVFAGSPLCVVHTFPGPDSTVKVTLLSEKGKQAVCIDKRCANHRTVLSICDEHAARARGSRRCVEGQHNVRNSARGSHGV